MNHSNHAVTRERGMLAGRSVVVGCGRLSVGNAHVSCRVGRHFCWSQAYCRWAVNPSRKLRRFESFTCHHVREGPLTCGNAGRGPSRVPGGGIQNGLDESTISALGRRAVTCANVEGERAGSTSAGNAPVSSGPRRRAGRTRPGADLRRYHGGGYAMTAGLQAIAIEQRWCQSCLSGNLPPSSVVGRVPLDAPAGLA